MLEVDDRDALVPPEAGQEPAAQEPRALASTAPAPVDPGPNDTGAPDPGPVGPAAPDAPQAPAVPGSAAQGFGARTSSSAPSAAKAGSVSFMDTFQAGIGFVRDTSRAIAESERVQQGVKMVKHKTREIAESESVQKGLEIVKAKTKEIAESELVKDTTRVVLRQIDNVSAMAWKGSAEDTLGIEEDEQWRNIKVQGAEEIVIPARTEHTIMHVVARGHRLRWAFRIKEHSIGFGIKCTLQENGVTHQDEILAVSRYDSANTITGSWVADEDWKVVLVFDNRNSMLRPKTIAYLVGTEATAAFARGEDAAPPPGKEGASAPAAASAAPVAGNIPAGGTDRAEPAFEGQPPLAAPESSTGVPQAPTSQSAEHLPESSSAAATSAVASGAEAAAAMNVLLGDLLDSGPATVEAALPEDLLGGGPAVTQAAAPEADEDLLGSGPAVNEAEDLLAVGPAVAEAPAAQPDQAPVDSVPAVVPGAAPCAVEEDLLGGGLAAAQAAAPGKAEDLLLGGPAVAEAPAARPDQATADLLDLT